MNILLTSVGRRSYLVKYFKKSLNKTGYIHVSNSNRITPASTFSDRFVITPLIYDNLYIPFLLRYCKENKIRAIIPLFDIDLLILSKNKNKFKKIGTDVIVSDENIINICNDKWKTYLFLLNNGYNTPKTYLKVEDAKEDISKEKLNFPLIIKPRWGMGSKSIYEVYNENELRVLVSKTKQNIKYSYLKYESIKKIEESVIIQEKLIGQEYGLDMINNLKGEYQTTIIKKKYSMRSGETDCSETVYNKNLKELGKNISKKLHHIGNMDLDLILIDNKPYIIDMNARFGGGYPFSHMAGVDLPYAIIKWLNNDYVDGNILKERIGIISHKDIEIVKIIGSENH